ncbi:MAG: thermonuclease family protein [Candidatus Omnitrophica bacterium]|nr:thermonuclease family protein [Candidatus Omnitrophota bacterium]
MKKRELKKLITLGVSLVTIAVFYSCEKFYSLSRRYHPTETSISSPQGYNYEDILVTRVIDGDTVQLESGDRVRLIGIDTPEIHNSKKLYRDSGRAGQDIATIKELGRKSHLFTKELIEGKRVRLAFDVERFDRYNRLLAYIYLADGTFVNAQIVKEGYASLMSIPPNVKYAEELRVLYREARQNKKGLWQ